MKILILFLLLASCAHKVRQDGGEAKFDTTIFESLSPAELPAYAQTVVVREERDPDRITLTEIKKSPEGQIKRAAILVFETEIQPSRSGLATDQNVYLSPRGKQILTEELLRFWENQLQRVSSKTTWIKRSELFKSKAYRSGGFIMEDLIMRRDDQLSEADVFWKIRGQAIPETSLLVPRDYQDVSMVFVPATQLMNGPKPSQHQHHWVNDVCRELNLDAVLLVYAGAEWRQEQIDKKTNEKLAEELKIKLNASFIYPFSSYHSVGEKKMENGLPKLNIPLATYTVNAARPIKITGVEQNFVTAQSQVLIPYRQMAEALSTVMIERLATDLHQISVVDSKE
jgi:hypothetical protein